MSLDVYLTMPGEMRQYEARIFIREDGQKLELTRAEWNERFPDREPVAMVQQETDDVFSANITHNLGKMANAAGIYECLWRPEEIGITKAKQLIEPLTAGLAKMRAEPDKFIALEPQNKWGTYEVFVPWIDRYLQACVEYPEADVRASR